MGLSTNANAVIGNVVSPMQEIIAYECLWQDQKASFKWLSKMFAEGEEGARLSDYVNGEVMEALGPTIRKIIFATKEKHYPINILIHGTFDFPLKLRDAVEPLEMLYYTGDISLLSTPCIAVVGTRKPSKEGEIRAKRIVKLLVEDGYTIVSGLAQGIDTIAHTTALEMNGKTIAVLGTPLNTFYPATNKQLQERIAKDHLVVSQVPFYRYSKQSPNGNKLFFPERNKTMSALTKATVIIEAGETSGTLIQARAALDQKRKLFILNSCFENPNITWPEKFHKLGAYRIREYSEMKEILECE